MVDRIIAIDDIIERLESPEDLADISADWAQLSVKDQEAGEAFLRSYLKLDAVLTDLVISEIEKLPDNVILLPNYVDKIAQDLKPPARAFYRKRKSSN